MVSEVVYCDLMGAVFGVTAAVFQDMQIFLMTAYALYL